MHMIFEIGDLISEQERCTNRRNIDWICKILDIDNSRLSSESSAVIGHSVDLDRNAEISHQLGGKETQVKNDLVKFINEHQQIQLRAALFRRI